MTRDAAAEPVRFGLRVRFHECDPQGVVFNAHYLAYADIASFELWRALCGSYATVREHGVDSVVVASQTRHLAAARFDDELDVAIAVARIGTTSYELATAISRAGELLAEVRVHYVFVDPETGAKTVPPAAVRAFLEAAPAPLRPGCAAPRGRRNP